MDEYQKKLVIDNLHLIPAYMKTHHLRKDVYYDILTIKLCEAAINYDPESGNAFSTLTYTYFNNAVRQHIAYLNYDKRKLDGNLLYMSVSTNEDSDETWEDYLKSPEESLVDQYIATEMLDNLYKCCLNDVDKDIIKSLAAGYTFEEIGNKYSVSKQAIHQKLRRIKKVYFKNMKEEPKMKAIEEFPYASELMVIKNRDRKTKNKNENIDFICEWARKRGLEYKDFQILESLGYLRIVNVSQTKKSIHIVNQSLMNKYIENKGVAFG